MARRFTGASSGNNVTLLNSQGPASPITGNGAYQTFYTYSLPALVMAAGKGIRITAIATHTTGTTGQAYQISFGGTAVSAGTIAAAASSRIRIVVEIFNNPGVTNAQVIDIIGQDSSGLHGIDNANAAIDTTAAVTINLQFNVANTDAITPRYFFVELIQ